METLIWVIPNEMLKDVPVRQIYQSGKVSVYYVAEVQLCTLPSTSLLHKL